jgi:hypothetical protein
MREGACDREGVFGGHLLEQAGELAEILVAAGPPALGKSPHCLHALVKELALLAAESRPEKLAEQPNVVSERAVLLLGRFPFHALRHALNI